MDLHMRSSDVDNQDLHERNRLQLREAAVSAALDDRDEQVRSTALGQLAKLKVDDPEVIGRMMRHLSASGGLERQAAATAFETVPAPEDVQIRLVALLSDKERDVRVHAMKALASAKPRSPAVLVKIALGLDLPVGKAHRTYDDDPTSHLWRIENDPRPVLKLLGEHGVDLPEIRSRVEALTRSNIPEVAHEARAALEKITRRPCEADYARLN